ncbi:methyltransferase domain-containing protein [Phytoactinopolyspora limicola]|uniref:methyltransferase domain-containing protein n=1 Tax=Phytoactinopolyspora limicola TaxID=2715536 RepID=UPI0014074FAE|nr:methyltransferase domain-containing protein [Phytoactinopolyspora limicola]
MTTTTSAVTEAETSSRGASGPGASGMAGGDHVGGDRVGHVGDGLHAGTGSWAFSGDVPRVFVDHARRSVPLYDVGHDLACDLSTCFVGRNGRGLGYELGSSTGELLRRLATHGPSNMATRWVGLDVEAGMTLAAREHCAGLGNVDVFQGDVATMSFEQCDFVVAYLTLHFLPLDRRRDVVGRVYEALRPGGAFFLFDKVLAADARLEDVVTTLHFRWKRRAGLSPEEILNKKESLLGVLQPVTTDENLVMLAEAGFPSVASVFKHLCFEGFVAVK